MSFPVAANDNQHMTEYLALQYMQNFETLTLSIAYGLTYTHM